MLSRSLLRSVALFFFTIAPAYGQTDLNSGLVADFSFNNDLGEILSSNGVTMGHDRFLNPLSSISFDSYLETLELENTFMDGLSDFTVSIWFKSTVGGSLLTAANETRPNECVIQILGDGTVAANVRNEHNVPGIPLIGTTNVLDNEWHHLVLTREGDSGNATFYLDGNIEVSGNMPSGDINVETGGFFLGNDQDQLGNGWSQENQFLGNLDDLKIYNRRLSAAEVTELSNLESDLEVDLAVKQQAHYDFNNRLTDLSSNGLNSSDNAGDFTSNRFNTDNYAIAFDDYLETTQLPGEVMDGFSDLSVSIWFKTSVGGAMMTAANASRSNEFVPQVLPAGNIAVNIRNIANVPGIRVDGTRNVLDNQWHHLVILREGSSGTTTLYLDGQHEATGNMPSGDLSVSANGLYLGNDQDQLAGGWSAENQFYGSLDDLWVFGRNLSYEEIETLFKMDGTNTPPSFTNSEDLVLEEDFSGTAVISVTPAAIPAAESGQYITYSISPTSVDFASVSIDQTTGEVTIEAVENASGSQQFTITANDGQSENNEAEQSFNLTVNPVNDPPEFTLSDDLILDEDFESNGTVSVSATAIPADEATQIVTYSISPTSVDFASVSIDQATGEVTIEAIENASGSQQFTITANDGQSENNEAEQSFNLTVNPVNDAPDFSLSDDLILDEDFENNSTVSVNAAAIPADEATQIVTYSISPTSVDFASVSIDQTTGEVTIEAIENASGSQQFTITANDGQSENNEVTQSFNLTVNPVNDAPDFSLSGDLILDEDFENNSTVSVNTAAIPADEATQIVTYSISPTSVDFASVSIDQTTGEVTIEAVENANGSQQFTITANDGQSENNEVTQSFNLTVNPVNDAPDFSLSGDLILDEDFESNGTVSVIATAIPADEATQIVTYSISPTSVDFASVSIDQTTGEVTVEAVENANGSQQFTITANDGQSENNEVTQSFNLTVNPVNDAPDFSLSGDLILDEDFENNSTVSVNAAAIPADELAQTVTYSISPTSVDFASVSIDQTTGEVTVEAVENASGSQQFTITANDGQSENNEVTQSFNLTVNPVNDAPVITAVNNTSIQSGESSMITITASDIEGDALSMSITSGNSEVLEETEISISQLNSGEFQVTLAPAVDKAGQTILTVTVNDGQDDSSFQFEIDVLRTIITSVEDPIFHKSIELYPNPTNGLVTLKTNRDSVMPVSLSIYNSASVVFIKTTSNWLNNELSIDLSQLPNGLYFIRVAEGDRISIKKVMKK